MTRAMEWAAPRRSETLYLTNQHPALEQSMKRDRQPHGRTGVHPIMFKIYFSIQVHWVASLGGGA